MSPGIHDWRADFAVFDQSGQLTVIAEAKKKSGADPRWASEWFRNYLAHQQTSAPPFILLATPETLYLWKRSAGSSSSEPTAIADARRVFSFYLDRSNLDATTLGGQAFEIVVGAWLHDLSHLGWQPSTPDERQVLVDSGLLDAIKNGRVVSEVAA